MQYPNFATQLAGTAREDESRTLPSPSHATTRAATANQSPVLPLDELALQNGLAVFRVSRSFELGRREIVILLRQCVVLPAIPLLPHLLVIAGAEQHLAVEVVAVALGDTE